MMMIPPFLGNNDPDVYLDWEKKCEIAFNQHNIADINRVKLAAMELKYYALSWWKQVETARAYNGAYEISTWGEMKRVMRQRFVPNHYQRELHSKLRKHSQGNHSVEEYYSSHGKSKPKQPDKITKPYPRHISKETSHEPQESTKSKGKHSVSQQLQELTFCSSKNRDHVSKEIPSKVIPSSISPNPLAAESVKEVPKDHAEKSLGAKDVSVQTPCYELQGNKKQEIVSVSNNGKVQAKLSQTVYDDSMTGIMHLSFSKSVETGTGSSEEQMEKANQEKDSTKPGFRQNLNHQTNNYKV
ncbi:unnamed protein product [Microthlaspi erraticum]|uniref:Retrotransposon gag domain-containing protein n=1 Tax=Microthlaspi erraticum TaxID=1685480 RepID=A0A6D2IY81_9BRAS|nr:unnamed protein product [Microthlaspi erraticum]